MCFFFFLMLTDMTAVTIQPNKTILNEVKDNESHIMGKTKKKQKNSGYANKRIKSLATVVVDLQFTLKGIQDEAFCVLNIWTLR